MGGPKIVVIGGVATGPKAAARARRLLPQASITVVEQGTDISYGSCGLPLYLTGQVPDIHTLSRTPSGVLRDARFFADQKDITVFTGTQARRIDRRHRSVEVIDLARQQQFTLEYDYLVLATGARPVRLHVPGGDLPGVFYLREPRDAVAVRGRLREKAAQMAVIGAGLIGLEVADALARPKVVVSVIEKEEQVLPGLLDVEMASLVARALRQRKVQLHLGALLEAFRPAPDGTGLGSIVAGGEEMPGDLAVVAVGVQPEVNLAREAGLDIGPTGAMAVNEYLQTEDPLIYAGGDCVENTHLISRQKVYTPMASVASKHGRVIGSNLAGQQEKFPGVLGTTVLQAFDLNIGVTGLTEQKAREAGYQVVTCIVPSTDAAHYHPLHGEVILKLVADQVTGRLLGAQAVGNGEVVKRIDVLATALSLGARVDDLSSLDLGYAPVFATPLDVAIQAANVLRNKQAGLAKGIGAVELRKRLDKGETFTIVDVRQPEEVASRRLSDGQVHYIPAGELRRRMGELHRGAEIVCICELGVRSYEAAMTLQGAGFTRVSFLEGGLEAWPWDLSHG